MGKIETLDSKLAAAETTQQKIDILNALAWELRDVDIRRGSEIAQSAYHLAQSEQYSQGIADSLINQSQYLFTNFVLAISNALKALTIFEQLNDQAGQCRAFFTLSWAQWSIDNFGEAIEAGQKALKLAREIGDRELEATTLNNLGLTYKRAGNYELSFSVYAKALSIYRELGHTRNVGKVLTNTALAYSAQGNFATALGYACECLESNIDSPSIRGYNYLALGQIHAGLQQFDQALIYLPQALSIAREHALEALSLAALQFTGQVHLESKNAEQAIAFLEQALIVGQGIHSNLFLFRCHESLAQIYESQANPLLALAHYKQFHQIKETVFNENDTKQRQVLEIYHQTEIARREAEIYQLRNVQLEQEISERKKAEQKLEQQATTDELTGIANRRHFLAVASRELKRSERLKRPLSLALIDIDYFKTINDSYGHAAGDHALILVAKTMHSNIREIDFLARIGGDEFALLVPEADLFTAKSVLERVRLTLSAQPIGLNGIPLKITISVGISSTDHVQYDFDSLSSSADKALYQSKQTGRNRITLGHSKS